MVIELELMLFQLHGHWIDVVSITQMAKKNKEKYMEEMEAYKLKKQEEAQNVRMEEEEQMKLQKQEALQLLKKKEKTENIIKVPNDTFFQIMRIVFTQKLTKVAKMCRKRNKITRKRIRQTPTSLKSRHPHSSSSGW